MPSWRDIPSDVWDHIHQLTHQSGLSQSLAELNNMQYHVVGSRYSERVFLNHTPQYYGASHIINESPWMLYIQTTHVVHSTPYDVQYINPYFLTSLERRTARGFHNSSLNTS